MKVTNMNILERLEPVAVEIVTAIESKPAITQNRYDAYMNVLAQANQRDPRYGQVLALALAVNGANKEGLKTALYALDMVK